MADTRRLFVTELFSAIQGEGRYVGSRQIFLRLAGCDLRCSYCDEPASLEKKPGVARIEKSPGSRDFVGMASPMHWRVVLKQILAMESQLRHGFLSVTGGEPLLQESGLSILLPECRSAGLKVMLETSGTHVDALKRVATEADVISMDIKLESVDSAGVDPRNQQRFLEAAISIGAEIYCKSVVSERLEPAELLEAASWIATVNPTLTLYLQPVTGEGHSPPSPSDLLNLQRLTMDVLSDVRVVPQVHKLIGQM